MSRGQASLTVIEASVGILLMFSLAFAFTLGSPGEPAPTGQAQLDAYAEDTATLLSSEQPRHADQTRLAELVASPDAFEREAGALERRVADILPANVFFRMETAYGSVGYSLPSDVQTGSTTVPTTNGDVTIRVWYA